MAVDENGDKKHCFWHTEDGQCSNCKARRFRYDVIDMKEEYGKCHPAKDYATCVFFKIPVPIKK
jgi:hypothetical protein